MDEKDHSLCTNLTGQRLWPSNEANVIRLLTAQSLPTDLGLLSACGTGSKCPSCALSLARGDQWAHRGQGLPSEVPAIKMTDGCFPCFCLRRQASLNEAAEKYYGRAASLRPNVSTVLMTPLLLTVMDAQLQSQAGWLSQQSTALGCPDGSLTMAPIVKDQIRKTLARFVPSLKVC